MKLWLKIILLVVLIPILSIGGYILTHNGFGIDPNNLPQFIKADFIDLSKIYSISKFRSGEGHDFSGGGETCRSMKHYFTPQYDPAAQYTKDAEGKGLPPKPDGKTDIPIYSPVDGRIQGISEEHTPIGKQISIRPASASQFNIRLFHVYPSEGIKMFSKVTAGQQIGVIGKNQGTDIAVEIGGPWHQTFVSYFEVMSDSVFAAYTARGATSRNDFIITQAYRDAHPLQCANDKSEAFIYPANYDHTVDDFHLSGYVMPDNGQTNAAQNQNNTNPPQNYGSNVPEDQQKSSGQNQPQ